MIFILGSCLYEITFISGQPQWSGPGGSALNTSVSLARSDNRVQLLTELGRDKLSDLIARFLNENGVVIDQQRYQGKTRLSLAFVDDAGEANYVFYEDTPVKAPLFDLPAISHQDVALLGSLYSIQERNKQNVDAYLEKATKAGAYLIYDPNFRKTFNEFDFSNRIKQIIGNVDLVRASCDDMLGIAGVDTGRQAYEYVKSCGCTNFIYTRNGGDVDLFTAEFHRTYPSKKIPVVSSIGAGDGFNAGLISFISKNREISQNMDFWDKAIESGLIFAAAVCGSHENYIGNR
ncbi:MAG: PfkB family carbohydrate kinase [Lentimicrobiaceae bacterium]|nr:PfkB family carbohydrate kinase [Lentimicrobiaceae bacterium]